MAVGLVMLFVGGCVDDELELSHTDSPLVGENKLGANKLGANKLGANKLGANNLDTQALMSTPDGREVMGFIVGCALGNGQTLTATDPDGVPYTYQGWLNLAPDWATRAPTVAERRWVTSCLLARTNVFGQPVNISLRHDSKISLLSSAPERALYTNPEGAFFGDLFASSPVMYGCGNRAWAPYSPDSFRACALSSNSVTTDCSFTYVGSCNSTKCTDRTAPFGGCKGGVTTYAEVITIFLTPTQQQGQPQ
jgi:hypothetical protein